ALVRLPQAPESREHHVALPFPQHDAASALAEDLEALLDDDLLERLAPEAPGHCPEVLVPAQVLVEVVVCSAAEALQACVRLVVRLLTQKLQPDLVDSLDPLAFGEVWKRAGAEQV